MAEPKVSIVIPTYNRAAFIERTLTCAISQTYKNIEVVVCDNASDDDTEAIVADFQRKNPNFDIRYIRHSSNIGPVRNWFSGIRASSGEYIKILFSDDLIYPNCIEDLLGALHGTGFAFSYGIVDNRWQGSSVTSYSRIRPGSRVSPMEYIGVFFSPFLSLEDYPISPGAALFKKEPLLEIPLEEYTDALGYDVVSSGIGPDMLMFLYSFWLSDNEAVFVNRKIAAFEGHSGSITIKSGLEKLDSHNFAAVLKFYSILPSDVNISRILRYYFNCLASKPSYFRRPDGRLEMLLHSGYYIPLAQPLAYPLLGALAAGFRRIQRAIEFRVIRLLGRSA